MEYKYIENLNRLIIRLDKGDELISQIKEVCEKEHITLGTITGLGATDNVTVGVFNLTTSTYDKFNFTGNHEITNITGNITTMNNSFYSHIHITLAGKNGQVVGGHLLECYISLTAEIFIDVIKDNVDREKNYDLGINILKF